MSEAEPRTIEAYSPEFEWTTEQGKFTARVYATIRDGKTINEMVAVYRDTGTGQTNFCMWTSLEVGRPDGNSMAEFEAWRMHATGYEPTNDYLRGHVSFQREHARWEVGAYTPRTTDHVDIVDGLRVWTNDLERGAVDLNYRRAWQEPGGEWWFYVKVDGRDEHVMQSETRVATRFEGKPA